MMNEIFKTIYAFKPTLVCNLQGSSEHKNIAGVVKFYECKMGVIVVTEITNLPPTKTNFFAMHIHENGSCQEDFESAGVHYGGDIHPLHKGDLPPLLSCNGRAFSATLTDRFSCDEIVDRSVIIHLGFDDFSSQPSGNSGKRIACGVIKKY